MGYIEGWNGVEVWKGLTVLNVVGHLIPDGIRRAAVLRGIFVVEGVSCSSRIN